MPDRWMSRISIRWVLPIAIALPVVLVAVVLTLLGYKTATRTSDDLAGQNMRHIHQRIEAHLTHLLDLPVAMNQLNLTRLRESILSLDDPAASRNLIYQTMQIFPDISSIGLGGADGKMIWIVRYPGEVTYEYGLKTRPDGKLAEYHMAADGTIGDQPLREFDFDPRLRPWYQAAIDAKGPTWAEVYVWVRGGRGETLGVTYVDPVFDATGTLKGVINCELTLSDISAFLRRLEVGNTGVAFVMERDGDLVANGAGLSCMKDGVNRLPAIEAENPQIANVAKALPAAFGPLVDIRGQRRAHLSIDGVATQVVVSSFRNRQNMDWLIVTAAPDADFLAEATRSLVQATWFGIGAAILALACGVVIAIWLLRPILAVVQHAKQVGGGDLEDASLERHDNREVSLLSHAINDMASGLQDRLRMRHALSLAMDVQQSLLPSTGPSVKGVNVAARSQYCDETGGDYYDYLNVEQMSPHSLVVALGDVMGHGIAAAMLMATARGILRSHVRTAGTLGDLLTHVNELLVGDTKGTRFMTMFLGIFDSEAMSLRWASAGHDPPLLYDPELKKEIPIEGLGGLPLGVMDHEKFDEMSHAGLRDGQIMLVGTDGLWESKNETDEQFGKARVIEAMAALAHLDAAGIEAGIYQRFREFCGTRSVDDDITYVVLKFSRVPVDAPSA